MDSSDGFRWTRRQFVGLAFGTVAAGVAMSAAAGTNDRPERALPFGGAVSADIPGVTPMLGEGNFLFYRFSYPGDGSTITLEVDLAPGDQVTADRAGFHVYGPTEAKLYATGAQTSTRPSLRGSFSSSEAGIYLLQLYNYNVTPVHYDVIALGLSPQPDAAPPAAPPPAEAPAVAAPPPTATPIVPRANTAADRAIELTGPVEATLEGNSGGSYHYYSFGYPGDNTFVRLTMNVAPSDPPTARASGFVVYGPIFGREYARAGFEARLPPHVAVFQAAEQGLYIVQVGNYLPNPIRYRLELTR